MFNTNLDVKVEIIRILMYLPELRSDRKEFCALFAVYYNRGN